MPSDRIPYRQAGLSAPEAAAHLLGRFTFGAAPGEVARVAEQGLDDWFEAQLRADAPDSAWDEMARSIPAVSLATEAAVARTVSPKRLREQALAAGAIASLQPPKGTRDAWLGRLDAFRQAEGLFVARELADAAVRARIARAALGQNQLHEVMAAFWANHLYVGKKDLLAQFLGAYDRDVIRPHALGRFGTLLGASARHPAMLLYLDNVQSSAAKGAATTAARLPRAPGRSKGINENYARELMELHTLGVDGPYTQADVVAVARVFTGWHVVPASLLRKGPDAWAGLLEKAGPDRDRYVLDGLFLFRADLHDAGPKTVLGEQVPAGGGIEEGDRLLDRLARHPVTARHLASKLARRFAADLPPDDLIGTLTAAFLSSGGDTRAVLRALVASPAFWSEPVVRAKVKTPFELAISAVRGTGAQIDFENDLDRQLRALGEAPFAHLAPDGYPDHASAWINAGTLLGRMRFGVDFATGRLDGVHLDAGRFVAQAGYDPRDTSDALDACLDTLLAGRDHDSTRELLQPVLQQSAYADRIAAAAPPPATEEDGEDSDRPRRLKKSRGAPPPSTPAQQALSVVLGSPEFQRQ